MLKYLYDDSGIIGMVKDGTSYYFHRNIQGDVVGVYNSAGTKLVTFKYDAYGNCTVSGDTVLAHRCKIRYRGYYFDTETGLYWVQTRYYNPEWCRWISPDTLDYLDPETAHGLNLYAYCGDDPVSFTDPSGHDSLPNWAKWLIGGVFFVGAIMLTAITGGALTPVVSGMALSIVTDGLVEGTVSMLNGGDFMSGFANGAANGAMFGGMLSFGGAALRTIKLFKNGVAIGENMKRVNRIARYSGQVTYAGMPGYKIIRKIGGETLARNLSMQHNKSFIERMMKFGVNIVDYGIDVLRPDRSYYYLMETIVTRGYSMLDVLF